MAGTNSTRAPRRKVFATWRDALEHQQQHPTLTVYYLPPSAYPNIERRWIVGIRQPPGAEIAVIALSGHDPNIRFRKSRRGVISVYAHGQRYLEYLVSQDSPALRCAIGTFLRSRNAVQKKRAGKIILRLLSGRRWS